MNIWLFNRKYWVRRFGETKNVKGHLVSKHEDFVASLHVHPTGTNTMQALPEGQRKVIRLEGHGEVELFVADEATGRKGDLLYYYGNWYECVNAQHWRTTLLSHLNYQFVLVPKDGAKTTDLAPPVSDPNNPPVVEPDPPEGGGDTPGGGDDPVDPPDDTGGGGTP